MANEPGMDSSISFQMGEAIIVRLSQVERELKSARRTNAMLSAGLIAATLLAVLALGTALLFRGRVSAIDTQQIVLRDTEGAERGVFRINDDGGAVLALQDRNGLARLRLSVLNEGSAGIALTDSRGRSRVVLGFLPEQGGTLVFADEEGNSRAVLGVTGEQAASLAFLDGFGTTRASFGIDDTGVPAWAINEGTSAATVPADTTGGAP